MSQADEPIRGVPVTLGLPADWPEDEIPVQVGSGDKARLIPPTVALDAMREQGPVSTSLADLYDDARLNAAGLARALMARKSEALAEEAQAVVADPGRGPVGEIHVPVGKRTVVVTDITAAGGAVTLTVSHPDLPERHPNGETVNPIRFVNPPIMAPVGVEQRIDELTGKPVEAVVFGEDLSAALAQMVADVVTDLLGGG